MSIPYVADKKDVVNVTKINGRLIYVVGTTSCPGGHVRCEWTLDFTECTDDEILELAKRSIVITEQGRMRRAKREELEGLATRTINVKHALAKERGNGKPPTVAGTLRTASRLTDDEKRELLRQLTESMGGDPTMYAEAE